MHPVALRGLALVALVAGGLALQASPARADVLTDMTADVEVSAAAFPTGPACTTLITSPAQANTPVPADGQPHTATVTVTVTATQSAGNTMTATVTETRTITATAVGGQLARVLIADAWTASFQAAGTGAACNVRISLHGDTAGHLTLLHPVWATVTATGHGVAESAGVSNDADPLVPGSDVYEVGAIGGGTTGSAGTGQGLLPVQATGGRLVIFPTQETSVWAPTAGAPTVPKSGTGTVDIRLDTPGAATGPASGPGHKYVALPAALECTAHTAAAQWTAKEGKGVEYRVVKAVFKVGHAKVGKARRPTTKKVTTLKKLPATGPVEVVGTLALRTGKTVTVRRSYLPCG